MLKKITLSGGQLVISKDACPFQEVIDSFSDAKRISVVTFNISKWNNEVLGAMKKSHALQRLITNIPNRRDDYSKGGIEAATETIRRYLNRLDPAQFKPLARVFFCFKNHAKIIMTDKIAYVGSANFSDESQGNWEAGTILRDPAVLTAIEAEIDELEKDSIRYFGGEMQKTVPPILAARNELGKAFEQFSMWPTKENRRAFIRILKEIDDTFKEVDVCWTIGFVRTGPISSIVDRDVLKRIGLKLVDFDHIDKLIAKAENGEINSEDVEVDNDGEIPDWGFESVIDSLDRKRDEKIVAIGGYVREFIAQIEALCTQISNNVTHIDNTTREANLS